MTIAELTKILKPSANVPFMQLCANFLAKIKEAKEAGREDYEIAARYTKSGNPHVIRF